MRPACRNSHIHWQTVSSMSAPRFPKGSTSTRLPPLVLFLLPRHGFFHGSREASGGSVPLGEADDGVVQPKDPRSRSAPVPDIRCSLMEHDPQRIVRTTIEALAALGGTQSPHTNSFDEALACLASFRCALRVIPSLS